MSVSLAEKPQALATEHCAPCQKQETAFNRNEAEIWLQLLSGWSLDEKSQWISKSFRFDDFASALAFANRIGEVAEKEKHHPDIALGWGYVTVKLQTHTICGLHRNDFILAAKIDKAL